MAEDNSFAKQIEALEEIQTDLEKSITSCLKAIDIRQKVLGKVKGLVEKLKDGTGLTPEDILETDAVFTEMADLMKKSAKEELDAMIASIKRDEKKTVDKKPEEPKHKAVEDGAQQVEFFDDGTFIVIK